MINAELQKRAGYLCLKLQHTSRNRNAGGAGKKGKMRSAALKRVKQIR